MNFGNLTVLVTAVGSELAFSILKSAKLIQPKPKLIGTDIYSEVPGKYWVDEFVQVPPAEDEERYVSTLVEIVERYNVNALIPTSEFEIALLTRRKDDFKNRFGCFILTNDPKEHSTFTDKWLSYQWYRENNVGTPLTLCANQVMDSPSMIDEFRYPLIVKPRVGGGSRFVMNVKNAPQLRAALEIVPLAIIQECIGTDDSEYTAGTYRASSGEIYTIVMKRRLKFGMTNSAEVVFDANLTAFCRDVIGKSGLRGANNLQFRLDKEGLPKMLEVNPRFSGTSGMRAHFGFNELKLWLSDLFLPTLEEPTITKGKVLRYMEEMYLDEE